MHPNFCTWLPISEVLILLCAAQYEDETLQAMALSVIPEDELQAAADAAIEESRQNGDAPVLAQQDAFVRQMLLWFKRDFFSWVSHVIACQ